LNNLILLSKVKVMALQNKGSSIWNICRSHTHLSLLTCALLIHVKNRQSLSHVICPKFSPIQLGQREDSSSLYIKFIFWEVFKDSILFLCVFFVVVMVQWNWIVTKQTNKTTPRVEYRKILPHKFLSTNKNLYTSTWSCSS
jgi:hypothetical protein